MKAFFKAVFVYAVKVLWNVNYEADILHLQFIFAHFA